METEAKKVCYLVKTESFEGPLDLLLSLIEKRKMLINDISLSKVADDYICFLQNKEIFPIKDTSDFLVIASTLLLIKSKSLLPGLLITEEEKSDIHDLELKLKIYKRIKELSIHIKEKFGQKLIYFPEQRKFEPVFSPDESMNKESLLSAVFEAIKNLPKVENKPKVKIQKTVSLEEMITNLTERVKSSLKMSFKEFSKMGKVDRVNVIVSFLAMLELVKQGIIEATQNEKCGDIQMETKDVGIPSY